MHMEQSVTEGTQFHPFKTAWDKFYRAVMKREPSYLWNSFKERLGISEFCQVIFNLDDLIQPSEGLDSLEAPFTEVEIEGVVSKLPNDKSPGPDGYKNEFIKGCWPLIAHDFLQNR